VLARAWIEELVRSLWAALVDGSVDPRPPRTRTVRIWPFPGFPLAAAENVALSVLLYVSAVAFLLDSAGWGEPAVARGPLLYLLPALPALLVALRNRYPLATWRSSVLALVALLVTWKVLELTASDWGLVYGQVIAHLLVLYTVGRRTERRTAMGVWAAGLPLLAFAWPVVFDSTWLVAPAAAGAVITGVPLVLAQNVRARRQAQERLAQEEARTQRERDQRAVLQERGRIARELHDVVAHHMSVIAIQAEAAPLRAGDRADLLRGDLAEIRAAALEALTEMRRILGVLREPDDAPATGPQPGLRQLGDLVERASAGGLRVRTTLHVDTADLPPAVALSAYRIVQESLSNALRHAPGAEVDVEVVRAHDRVELAVVSGPPAASEHGLLPGGAGQGLVGMRERAAILGGTLVAGPTAAGGFAVRAVLPLRRQEASA